MLNINRQFGKFMKRSADESQVSVLLKDFDDADKLLQKVFLFVLVFLLFYLLTLLCTLDH